MRLFFSFCLLQDGNSSAGVCGFSQQRECQLNGSGAKALLMDEQTVAWLPDCYVAGYFRFQLSPGFVRKKYIMIGVKIRMDGCENLHRSSYFLTILLRCKAGLRSPSVLFYLPSRSVPNCELVHSIFNRIRRFACPSNLNLGAVFHDDVSKLEPIQHVGGTADRVQAARHTLP